MTDTRLLVNGSFSNEDFSELETILVDRNVKVERLVTNAIETQEIVRLIFQEFNAYEFLRDGILFESLMLGLRKAVEWSRSKKPNAEIQTKIELRYKETPINIGIPLENDNVVKEIERSLTIEYLDSVDHGESVNVYWDKNKEEVRITKF